MAVTRVTEGVWLRSSPLVMVSVCERDSQEGSLECDRKSKKDRGCERVLVCLGHYAPQGDREHHGGRARTA